VETAFLEGELEPHEYVYMRCPEGMDLAEDECLEIRRGMYGLAVSARVFFMKAKAILEKIGFRACGCDQCLFYKHGNKSPIIVMLYVDDAAVIGSREDIDRTFEQIREAGLNIKTEGKLNDFLGCAILREGDKKECWLLQTHLIKKLEKNFKKATKKLRMMCTPGSPRKIIRRNTPDDVRLNKQGHRQYRSGVGSLLYLLKHSRPELCNPIRELSKAMQEPNTDHRKEMLRVIKWVVSTANHGLRIKPEVELDESGNIIWTLCGYCDSTWGSDPDDGKSVSGYIMYFMGVPIVWKSKTQRHVTLSSTEAEHCSSTELVKEMLYVKQILESLDIEVRLPMKIYIDNIGAIQMVRNNISNTGTRHMNIKLHFVRDLHGKVVEYEFVRSENNIADILTKNATKAEHERHAPKMIGEVPKVLFDTVWKNEDDEDSSENKEEEFDIDDEDDENIEEVYCEKEKDRVQPVAE